MWKEFDYKPILEQDRIDLTCGKKLVQVKFHFNFDIYSIYNEFNIYGDNRTKIIKTIKSNLKKNINMNWEIIPAVIKDLYPKEFCLRRASPDIFLWIILFRKLEPRKSDYKICMSRRQLDYQKRFEKKFNDEATLTKFLKIATKGCYEFSEKELIFNNNPPYIECKFKFILMYKK